MTCPAITVSPNSGQFSFGDCHLFYISEKVPKTALPNVKGSRLPDYSSNEERFDVISAWAMQSLDSLNIHPGNSHVFIEGYAMGAKGLVFDIAEHTGVLKHKLWKTGFLMTPVPPTVIKKFATTKGNARKEQMYRSFLAETGIELMKLYQPKAEFVGSPVGDLVDSYYICKYGHSQKPKFR